MDVVDAGAGVCRAVSAGVCGWTMERAQQPDEMARIPEKARERVLLLSLSEHLERSQIVLTELANASPGRATCWRSGTGRAS